MTYELRPLTPDDAPTVLQLTAEDRTRSGIPDFIAHRMFNPDNKDSLKKQENKLKNNSELYMGVVAAGHGLVAVRKAGPWYAGDQKPFDTVFERARSLVHRPEDAHPLGIFALNVAEELGSRDKIRVGRMLMDNLLPAQQREQPEVRIGLHESDPLKSLLEKEYGFKATGKHAKVQYVNEELFIRPSMP
jgi:hypothetical protein